MSSAKRSWLLLFLLCGHAIGCGDDDTTQNATTTSSTSTGTSDGGGGEGAAATGGIGGEGGGDAGNGGDGGSAGGSGGSGGEGGNGGNGGAGGDGGSAPVVTIPSPGGATDAWFATPGLGIDTPGTAWPVGIATQGTPYVEGDADMTSGNAFFVFEAGPALTEISVYVFGADYLHLHDGTGLEFGAEITPTASTMESGTWPVTAGQIYVLEIHIPGGGFF